MKTDYPVIIFFAAWVFMTLIVTELSKRIQLKFSTHLELNTQFSATTKCFADITLSGGLNYIGSIQRSTVTALYFIHVFLRSDFSTTRPSSSPRMGAPGFISKFLVFSFFIALYMISLAVVHILAEFFWRLMLRQPIAGCLFALCLTFCDRPESGQLSAVVLCAFR